jgi:hypothetical protein
MYNSRTAPIQLTLKILFSSSSILEQDGKGVTGFRSSGFEA